MPSLFDPIKLGALSLPSRIIMAPLTRSRAHPDTRVPSDLAVEYYRQRAGAGLIISEATSVTPMGVGYAATPGIWSFSSKREARINCALVVAPASAMRMVTSAKRARYSVSAEIRIGVVSIKTTS